MGKYSIVYFIISFLVLVMNMIVGMYSVYIERPIGMLLFGILSCWFVIWMNNRQQYKHDRKYDR